MVGVLQFRHRVDLAADLKDQVRAPLHRLGGVAAAHAITAHPFDIHRGLQY